MIVTSAMAGTFVSVVRPTASSATAISLRALFLAPDDGDLAHEAGATDDAESLSHPANPIGPLTPRGG